MGALDAAGGGVSGIPSPSSSPSMSAARFWASSIFWSARSRALREWTYVRPMMRPEAMPKTSAT